VENLEYFEPPAIDAGEFCFCFAAHCALLPHGERSSLETKGL
jgi:hypothetical protein